jgi:hypothetical protein
MLTSICFQHIANGPKLSTPVFICKLCKQAYNEVSHSTENGQQPDNIKCQKTFELTFAHELSLDLATTKYLTRLNVQKRSSIFMKSEMSSRWNLALRKQCIKAQ